MNDKRSYPDDDGFDEFRKEIGTETIEFLLYKLVNQIIAEASDIIVLCKTNGDKE